MTKKKSTAAAPKAAPEQDFVVARVVFDQIMQTAPNLLPNPERIDAAIRDGRVPYGFSKSGNGTKGGVAPEKPFTVTRSETDPTKPVGTISPVCASMDRDALLARFMHVFVAIGAYEYDKDKPRIYTKEGFAAAAARCGLGVTPGKEKQAYGSYTVLTPYLKQKLEKVEMPPMPFEIAGTKPAPPRRTFNLKGFDPAHGEEAYGFFPLMNPAHPEVSEAECMNHAANYQHLLFYENEREDIAQALAFVNVKTLADEATRLADAILKDEQDHAAAEAAPEPEAATA
jgi:hypothetical protein